MLAAGAPDHVDIALLGPDAQEQEVRRHRSRPVAGLRALVHGHFVVDEVERVGNRWNIDTGAPFARRDRLTLLHVNARRIPPWTFESVRLRRRRNQVNSRSGSSRPTPS